ncbi:hypothetical protein LX36DRAFT_133443 [Colletotrichum falcatum]|nr:hypothetical protein LX36DRAFT_133443 [Colletotrichum falcatum]
MLSLTNVRRCYEYAYTTDTDTQVPTYVRHTTRGRRLVGPLLRKADACLGPGKGSCRLCQELERAARKQLANQSSITIGRGRQLKTLGKRPSEEKRRALLLLLCLFVVCWPQAAWHVSVRCMQIVKAWR